MPTTTTQATLLSSYVGPQGRQGWTLTLASDPGGPPCWVGYSRDGSFGPGPWFPVPRDSLTVSQGGAGQVTPGDSLWLYAPVGTSYTFTEIDR